FPSGPAAARSMLRTSPLPARVSCTTAGCASGSVAVMSIESTTSTVANSGASFGAPTSAGAMVSASSSTHSPMAAQRSCDGQSAGRRSRSQHPWRSSMRSYPVRFAITAALAATLSALTACADNSLHLNDRGDDVGDGDGDESGGVEGEGEGAGGEGEGVGEGE